MNRTSKGFTLIELLVVIAIIALLATMSITRLMSAQMKSRDAARATAIREIAKGIDAYFVQNDKYPPSESGKWSASEPDSCYANPNMPGLIPGGLAPYMASMPHDPGPPLITDCNAQGGSNPNTKDTQANIRTYIYASTGTYYIIMAHHPEQ